MTKTSNPGPVDTGRFGSIRVAVWENQSQDGRTYHSLDLERSYRDKDGAWQSQNLSLRANEIAKIRGALDQVYADLHLLPALQRSSATEEPMDASD
ncbi:hypothetical protein HNR46_004117 [Haloferula luteola]|uniref:Transcriptional coactivator p15 (PC4) C-terminal domain-containing protein n=1 Tax=Haloferula luteola TaxID=595692 RepID=A0A840V804_9BACT|nr:hypothetical protein [Haloferula luteola]MBB5353853.1 hypothetical protein [Haloferula luteola]